MAGGELKTIIVCENAEITASPCPAGQAPALYSAYVIQPASASYFDAIAEPFDYVDGAAFWSAAFVFTLSLYIGTRIYGVIINMVR